VRQIWITRSGPPEVLQVKEAPDPTPKASEVRIRVEGAAARRMDEDGLVCFERAHDHDKLPGGKIVDRNGGTVECGQPGWSREDLLYRHTNHVGISAKASGVNFADIMGRMGVYPDLPPIPVVPGYEISGRIDAVGLGVDQSWIGRDVIAMTRMTRRRPRRGSARHRGHW
jgi:NADPH:quinone reductase-like Zn-dependent oxidoreductase